MFDFRGIELSKGAHNYPSEGVCFNEALAALAGEPHSDMPECQSPVLGWYGIQLNDKMPHDLRNRLLPPLLLPAIGTRDDANERRRAEFLVMWTVNNLLPLVVPMEKAKACKEARTPQDVIDVINYELDYELVPAGFSFLAAEYILGNASQDAAWYIGAAASEACLTIGTPAWELAVEGLHKTILLGRHGGFAGTEQQLRERADKLRNHA